MPGQDIPRILVVEDVLASRNLLVSILEKAGFAVRSCVNGREAVDICAEWQPRFIWMDIRMPVMDGREATRRIRAGEAGSSVKISALTASGMEMERESFMKEGFDDYVRKPYRAGDIFEVMAKHLGLKYLYEADHLEKPPPESTAALSARQLESALSPELLGDLHTAVLILDIERTMQVIERIALLEPVIGTALQDIARKLDYERLLNLLENINTHTEGKRR
jgi:CheY-like chemotaxis protein